MRQQVLVQIGQAARILGGRPAPCDRCPRRRRNRAKTTAASGSPFFTFSPGDTSSRDTGPEKGASMTVAWSLSKSTVPVVSISLRNFACVTV